MSKRVILWSNLKSDEDSELLSEDFHELRRLLNISLERPIIAIADLGLWDGRHQGYQVVGDNIKNCFSFGRSTEEAEWYISGRDLRSDQYHHDGVNHVVYRVAKENRDFEKFKNKIYYGKMTKKDVYNYTQSIKPFVVRALKGEIL